MAAWRVILIGLVAGCGAPAPQPRERAADPEAECLARLVCNAPVCTCPEGHRCEQRCDDARAGCAECVPMADQPGGNR